MSSPCPSLLTPVSCLVALELATDHFERGQGLDLFGRARQLVESSPHMSHAHVRGELNPLLDTQESKGGLFSAQPGELAAPHPSDHTQAGGGVSFLPPLPPPLCRASVRNRDVGSQAASGDRLGTERAEGEGSARQHCSR